MLNRVILVGRLVSDIELRETQNGIPYTYVTLAINRPGNNNQTDFIDCVAWRGTADILDKYSSKGSLIAVEGRIEVYKTESNGNYDTRVTVNINTVTLLDSRKNNQVNSTKVEVSNPIDEQTKEIDREERELEKREVTSEMKNEISEEEKNEKEERKDKEESDFELDLDSIVF